MHARLRVRVGDAHLGFQTIRVAEEQAEDVAEVRHEPVGRTTSQKPLADLVKRVDRRRFQRQMIEPPPTEHRHLALVLSVACELEHVQLRHRADPHDRQLEPLPLLEHLMVRAEDAAVVPLDVTTLLAAPTTTITAAVYCRISDDRTGEGLGGLGPRHLAIPHVSQCSTKVKFAISSASEK